MSAPTTDATHPKPRGIAAKLAKVVATVAAIAALAFGAAQITKTDASPASAGTAQGTQASGPQGGAPPQIGTQVSGSSLDKLEAAATAKYPGTMERAMQLPDGSYVVHVIRSGGDEVHVLVSKDFEVTGTEQGPPAGAAPPSGQSAPSGSSAATGQSSS